MFDALTNLTKAAISIAVTPVAFAIDVVTLPISAEKGEEHPFQRTEKVLGNIGEKIMKTIE